MKKVRAIIGFILALVAPFVILALIVVKYFSDDVPFSIVCLTIMCIGVLGWTMIPDYSKEEKVVKGSLEQETEATQSTNSKSEINKNIKSKKELAFDIMIEKGIDYREIGFIRQSKNYEEYLYYMKGLIIESAKFTEDEFKLIKELIDIRES